MSFESSFDHVASGAMMAVAVLFFVIWLAAIAFGVVSYVLNARGMQLIARRRGIRKPWLAWIPVASLWILGSISDQYQYVAKGKIRNRRKVLLGLMIGYTAVFAVLEVAALLFDGESAAIAVLLVLGVLGALSVCIVFVVFMYIALYDLYASCDPDNAVLYLVLSIVLNVTMPFFVFACRNKDGGMPRRRDPRPAAPVIPEAVEAAEETEIPEEAPAGEETVEASLPAEAEGEEERTDVLPEEVPGEAEGE